MKDLQNLKLIRKADVYKNGILAGLLARTDQGGVRFAYTEKYVAGGQTPVAFPLPLSASVGETRNGALPPFFAGLLPEGHRLTVLKDAAKTSFDDELTLLLAVGADVPGDVQIVPSGETPTEPESLADTSHPEDLDFAALANSVDLHGLPGVQDKASASMLTTPLAIRGMWYILKLDPAKNPHLVVNEAAHLAGIKGLKIPAAKNRVISDRNGLSGLLVERFDRVKGKDKSWRRLPLEDGTQVMGTASRFKVCDELGGRRHRFGSAVPGPGPGQPKYLPAICFRCCTATTPWPCPLPAKPRTSKQGNGPNLPIAWVYPKKLRPRQTCSH